MSAPSRAARALALSALAALALAGCGGGDGGGSSSSAVSAPATASVLSATGPDDSSAVAYRGALAAICEDQRRQADALPTPATPAEVIDFLEAGLPVLDAAATRIGALVPPAALVGVHALAASKRFELTALVRSTVTRARAGEDPSAVLTANQPRLDALNADLDDLALQAAVPECAAQPAPAPATPTTGAAAPGPAARVLAAPERDAEIQRFDADITAAEHALAVIEGALAAAGPRTAPALGRAREEFAAAISRMDSYTLADAAAERRRIRLVGEGPRVADLIGRFLDAVAAGERVAIGRLRPRALLQARSFAAVVHPSSS